MLTSFTGISGRSLALISSLLCLWIYAPKYVVCSFGLTSPDVLNISNLVLSHRQFNEWLNTQGDVGILKRAVARSLDACERLFIDERWNCPLRDEKRRIAVVNNGSKETAFIHAISSASLTHEISRACSSHFLSTCSCEEPPDNPNLDTTRNWKWGGCGDNIKYARDFAQRFIRLNQRDQQHRHHRPQTSDIVKKVNRHNSRVGRKAVSMKITRHCKCHGVSGSCELKTCWRHLAPFHHAAASLKEIYDDDDRNVMLPENSANRATRPGDKRFSEQLDQQLKDVGQKLVYTSRSPSFCAPTALSPGTSGRVCRQDCGRLCCGRGTFQSQRTRTYPCDCYLKYTPHIHALCSDCSQNFTVDVCN